jgi:large subunit ribosomal protein L24
MRMVLAMRLTKQAYYDSKVFNAGDQDIGPRRESEMPIPMDDLRLVVPYASTSFSPSGQSIYEDVVVDNVVMERHTTGIDPFTGTDYGNAEIPTQHQYDPETGLPIFHRYIAGTRYRIAWPWETEKTKAKDDTLPAPNTKAAQGWLSKTMGTLRHPITTLQSWRTPPTKKKPKRAPSTHPLSLEAMEARVNTIEAREARKQRNALLRSEDPKHKDAHDVVDTTRNIVEGSESMSYTLVAPPFPESLRQELRGDIFEMRQEARNDPDAPHKAVRAKYMSEKALAAQEFAQRKAKAAERMKTPMQLRWEQAKKKLARKESPAVDTDTLLAALGQHMAANGVKLNSKRAAASQVAELD